MRRSLGIYLHVPFCRTRCRYCDFYKVGENRQRMDRFMAALEREIDGWTMLHGRRVETIFFGGGTPSLLDPEELAGVVGRVRERFELAPDAEITAEANPSDLSPARLAGLRAAGVNRLSVGVQSLVDRELRLLGRRHNAADAARVLEEARSAGFDNLSLDLMVGIPGQTEGSFRRSLERAIAIAPDHLSLYLLEVHTGSELDFLRRERPGLFAGEETQRKRYLALHDALTSAGYLHYEISNFARPGRECRHNLRYWRSEDWLGCGPAAHSSIGGRRFRHLPDLEGWMTDPLGIEEQPGDADQERVLLGLRLDEGVDESAFRAAGVDGAELDRRLTRLAPFVERRAERIRLTPEGFLVSNAVLAELLC